MKGIAPFLTAPQSAGKGSKKAKAGSRTRPLTAGKQGKQAPGAARTRFEAAVLEKMAARPQAAASRPVKGADVKARVFAARPEEAAEPSASQEKSRDREKSGALRPEAAMAALAVPVARQEAPLKAAAKASTQADRKTEAAAGNADPAAPIRAKAAFREAAAGKPRLTVTDLRKKQPGGQPGQGTADAADARPVSVAAARKEARAAPAAADGEGPLKAARGGSWDAGAKAPDTQAPARQVPVESLRDLLPPQLVKTAGIVVRDGDAGEIRLVLKPESLGSVRIRMSLGDNGIEGRILVESQAVKEIFEGRLEELAQALRQEGFQNANLSVSVSGGDVDGRRREAMASGPGPKQAGAEFDRAVPGTETLSLAGDYRVDLMA